MTNKLWQRMLDKAWEREIQVFDSQLCEELRTHLDSLSIESRMAFPRTPECIHQTVGLGHEKILIGCLKVDRYNFDFIDIANKFWDSKDPSLTPSWIRPTRSSRKDIHFGYVVRDRLVDSVKDVQLLVHKKGFRLREINREMTGFEWGGGDLADILNSDMELMSMLARLDSSSASFGKYINTLETKFAEKGSTLHIFPNPKENSVTFWQPVRDPRNFPSNEDIWIANRVCMHIRGMIPAKI